MLVNSSHYDVGGNEYVTRATVKALEHGGALRLRHVTMHVESSEVPRDQLVRESVHFTS